MTDCEIELIKIVSSAPSGIDAAIETALKIIIDFLESEKK